MQTKRRYIRPAEGSFFLLGPRGTGKSTWLANEAGKTITLDLLNPELHRRFLARPELLTDWLAANWDGQTVVIDEVQRVPELLSVVHHSIENANIRFILTGSSARKLKRTGIDLLAGRAGISMVHPFMASELGADFALARALKWGLVPLVYASAEPDITLAGYISLYLREEIMAEGLVRNIGSFSRFLEVISFSHGSILNISEVSRECEVSRKTVEGYVAVMEDMMLAERIPVFSKRAKRALVKQSKFYCFDAGVFRSLRPKGPLDRPEEIDGLALEGLVYQHLRAWCNYTPSNQLFFWRTPAGTEVDFVVYGQSAFCAFEVKNGRTVSRKDVRGLKAFYSDYPESTPTLLFRGAERTVIDGILCLPCEQFLSHVIPGSLAPHDR
ncbi:MAG: ATP-binding protein [Lentisphaerae bacterium]|nr:ATP-binding protein [Lentisphaerota bacterium]